MTDGLEEAHAEAKVEVNAPESGGPARLSVDFNIKAGGPGQGLRPLRGLDTAQEDEQEEG